MFRMCWREWEKILVPKKNWGQYIWTVDTYDKLNLVVNDSNTIPEIFICFGTLKDTIIITENKFFHKKCSKILLLCETKKYLKLYQHLRSISLKLMKIWTWLLKEEIAGQE